MNDHARFSESTLRDSAPRWRAPPDPVLPTLPRALDADAMAGILGRVLLAGRVVDCCIERVKYRPQRNALVLYRVAIETAGAAHRQCLLHACLYAPDEARRRFAAARKDLPPVAGQAPADAAALTLLEDQAMVVRAFPYDRKLAALPLLGDPARLAAEVLPGIVGGPVGACSVTPVSYFPEHAYSLRVELPAGRGSPQRLYAKTDADARGAATARAMHTLRDSAAHHDGRLRIARPRAWQPELATLWQDELPGRVLETLAGAAALPDSLAYAVGASLAALHATPVAGLPLLTGAAVLARTEEVSRTIAASLPELAAPLRRVVGRLARSLPATTVPATLHGDLHLNNIIVGADGIGFIDLDDLAAGPAAAELGAFVAGLIYRHALHGDPSVTAAAAVAAFLDGHAAVAGRRTDPAAVRWYAASALLRERAWRCLTSLKPGRVELIPALVGAAQALSGDADDTTPGGAASASRVAHCH